jgi:predicted MFS family arabinose efflux permease
MAFKQGRIPLSEAHTARLALLIGSGIIASAQIGKAIISIPMIRAEMSLSLAVAGLVVAIFATIGATTGIGAGVVVKRIGTRRALIAGMFAIAIGNTVGATAPNEAWLLVGRIIEGVGFFGVVLAIPSMLSAIVKVQERDFVMALWSAYMPAGITLMCGPLLLAIGWRNLWFGSAVVAASCGILAIIFAPKFADPTPPIAKRFFSDVAIVVRDRSCVLLAFAFFLFSCQIFSMAFALPILLSSERGLGLGAAGLLSAAVMAVSTIGHVSSGFFLRAGVPIWANIGVAFGGFAVTAVIFYSGALPPFGMALVAAFALATGGLAPGALYAAAPRVAPNPQSVPPTIGLLQQASNLGQFAGPVALGAWAQHLGWSAAPFIVAPAALCGLTAAFVIRRTMTLASRKETLPPADASENAPQEGLIGSRPVEADPPRRANGP